MPLDAVPGIDPALRSAALRSRRVPLWLRLWLLVVAVGIAGFWIATNSGLYAIIEGAQAHRMGGKHYLILSATVTLLATVIPAAVVVQLVALATRPRETR